MASDSERLMFLRAKRTTSGLTDEENIEIGGLIANEHLKNRTQGQGVQHVTLEVDSSKELEDIRKRLKEAQAERDDYKERLSVEAEKAFEKRARSLKAKGYRGEISTVDDLQKAEASLRMQDSTASGITPLNSQQSGFTSSDNLEDIEFDSIPEMMTYLNQEARKGNQEARQQLKKLERKIASQASHQIGNYEYEGSLKDFRKGVMKWKKIPRGSK